MINTLDKIHSESLKIFKCFTKICEKHNLCYYIIGGTLLGAVRHKGFIPWDDDIDVMMPRKDFNKFIALANDELPDNLKLNTFKNNKSYRYYTPRLVNTNTKIIEKRNQKEINVFIDIIPIDGVPNNIILRYIYILRVLFNRMLVSYYYIDEIDTSRPRKIYERILIAIGKILPTKKIINPVKKLYKIDKLLQSIDYDNSKYVGTLMGGYRAKEIMPKEYFGVPQKYNFEDMKVYGPQLYDKYLTKIYGNYMEIPKNKYTNQHLEFDKEQIDKKYNNPSK